MPNVEKLSWYTSIFFFTYFLEHESESEDDERLSKVESEDDEQLTKTQSEDDDEQLVKAQSEDDDEHIARIQLEDDDEQLAKAIQESLNMDSPPRYDHGSIFQPIPFFYPSRYR